MAIGRRVQAGWGAVVIEVLCVTAAVLLWLALYWSLWDAEYGMPSETREDNHADDRDVPSVE